MFGRKKETKRPPRPPGSLAQYGIFEIPENLGDLAGDDNDDVYDEDLEAELDALTAGGKPTHKPHRKAPPKPSADLDAMISESMKDVDDEELSGDDDDPDLLDELNVITGDDSVPTTPKEESTEKDFAPTPENNEAVEEIIKLLEERLTMYKTAEQKAKTENQASRARRFGRGVKTLEELLVSSRAGHKFDVNDLPPALPPSATGAAAPKEAEDADSPIPPVTPSVEVPASPVQETSPTKSVDPETLQLLKDRQQEYRKAAVAWKKSGNSEEAIRHVKLVKQFDLVINAIVEGNVIDLSDMPPSPTLPGAETSTEPSVEVAPVAAAEPLSLDASLKERLEVYRRTKAAAEEESNTSKARRYARICKQFEDAIKLNARGKPVALEDLPVPPGFPPLVTTPPKPIPEEPSRPAPPIPKPAPVAPPRTNAGQKKRTTSRADKQLQELQQRQRELKHAALQAKQDGDMELARDYLRQAKGIDPLITASLSGLPVDMDSIPLSPEAKLQLQNMDITPKSSEDGFTLVSSMDCVEEVTGDEQQIYENLEAQLKKQIKWCLDTRDHSKAIGDVTGYNRWERLALGYTRDVDMLRVRKRDNLPPPQHHYETKTYAIVQSCTDLNEGDVEISIIRGVNYSKEADTYVIYEFPFPTDSPSSDRTSTVRDTSNPEYNAVFTLSSIIDRKSRQCQRAFKRHGLKCQIWSKGCSLNPILCCTHPRGFFRSDSLLGTVTVKLQPLETKCILHDSFPLMDGRKATGGKLEVKMRLRSPVLTKQIEQITDRWLTIDH